MYLQAGSLFPNHWNRNSSVGVNLPMRVPVCVRAGQKENPAHPEGSHSAQGSLPSCHPRSVPLEGPCQEGANRTWDPPTTFCRL